ncbi:hypothetical protein MD484_g7287, partial [Candolleomyces efflorescens]
MTIDTTKTTVSDLKKVKNSVIGNPLAKDGIVRNEELMRRLIQSIADSENETPEEVKIEAAHIVASLSYGSEIALSALLKLNTPYVFVFALSKLFPEGSTTLRAAYARALRALVSSIADVVGPSEYGLRPETPPSLRLDAKEALDGMFSLDTLDVILPLLLSPSPQIQTPIVQLIASATRSSVHRAILVSWLPPDERRKEQGKAKKRGWEKLSASSSSSSSGSPVSPGASDHLTTDDKPLCQLAFERGCLDTLVRIVKDITPPDPVPVPVQMQMQMQMQRAKEKEKEKGKEGVEWRWDESEGEGVTRLREYGVEAGVTDGFSWFVLHFFRFNCDADETRRYVRSEYQYGSRSRRRRRRRWGSGGTREEDRLYAGREVRRVSVCEGDREGCIGAPDEYRRFGVGYGGV